MPAILIRIALWMMTTFAGQVLFSLGLGIASFSAIHPIMGFFQERIATYFQGSGLTMLIWMRLLDIPYGVSVLLSAFIIRTTIMSATVALQKK